MIDFQPDENKLDFQLDFQEEEKKPKTTVAEDIYSSVAQAANTIDTGASMIVGGLSRPFNKEFSDVVYNNMERRIAGRNKATDVSNKEQGIPGKVIGTVGTLPLQMAAMPFGPFESSKVALDQGESLGKAAGIFGIDALGTGLGLALPGVVPGKLLTKAASGAAINAAQDVVTRKAIELVADKETTKQILGPSLESAVVSGIVGGGIGALSKQPKKKQTTPTPKVDVDAIITDHKHGVAAPTEGLVKQDPIARMASDLGATQPDNPVMRSMVDQLNPDTQSAKMLSDEETARQLNAQRDIDARQAALEQEVRQRATLDLNAAERARQEAAPTGFAEWQEGLRTAAEQRLPGDNTPMPFEQIKAPYGLSDAPYQHGAGLDPTQFLAERQSLPVEVSHQLGKPYELPKVTDEVNSILRDGTVDERAGKMALPITVLDTLQSQRRGGKQSGAIDIEAISEGVKNLFRKAEIGPVAAVARQVTDNTSTPVSAGKVQERINLAKKEAATGLTNQYQRVTTLEQAKAMIDPETDMSVVGANNLRSGSEAVVRTNAKNGPLNFLRTSFQTARNRAEELSKTYITGKDGVIKKLKALSDEEADRVAEVMLSLDKHQVALDDTLLQKLELNDKQVAAVKAIRDALDARYAEANSTAGSLGYEAFPYRKGYIPSMFSGAYIKFVGNYENGKFKIRGIAQSDTKAGLAAALKKYAEMGYKDTVDGDFRGLKESVGYNRVYDGFAQVVARLAELDPEFAKAKDIADQVGSDMVRALYRFDVHELKKSGVTGSLGNRPWLSKRENTKDLFKAIVNYAEEGYRYDAMQKPLVESQKLLDDPEFIEKMPNTAEFYKKYTNSIKGTNLNVYGAAGNATINAIAKLFGGSQKHSRAFVNTIQQMSTSMMMGFGNLGFAAMQLTQPITGGIPEATRIQAATGLPTSSIVSSFVSAPLKTIAAWLDVKGLDPETKAAYDWAHQHGMFDFSEAELVHELDMSKTRKVIKEGVNLSINLSEKWTRPPVFMAYADMFRKAGYAAEEAFLRAQAATDYAMANYHPDERPAIYSALGETGKFLGALSTYKHNFLEQLTSTVVNAPREKAAAASLAVLVFSLYGLAGLPGYQEADKLVKAMTDKNIREILLDTPKDKSLAMEGLASYVTEMDIQSRVSMSQVLPDITRPMSVAPHISNTWNVVEATWNFAKNQDEASLRELISKASPTSFRNMYEAKVLTDKEGNVRKPSGELRTESPRTSTETSLRSGLGLRPIREKIEDETLWTQRQRETKRTDKLKEASGNFEKAVTLGDWDGANKAMDKYQELGGDVQMLTNKYEEILLRAQQTPKERAEGIPGSSLGSINRYQAYQ